MAAASIHQDDAVSATNNGVKCGMKNGLITLGGVLLVAGISALSAILFIKIKKSNQVDQGAVPLPPPAP